MDPAANSAITAKVQNFVNMQEDFSDSLYEARRSCIRLRNSLMEKGFKVSRKKRRGSKWKMFNQREIEQSVARSTHNAEVGGSNPSLATKF